MWRQCFRGMAHWWWVDALLIFDFVKKHNFVFRMRPLGGISQLLRSLTQRFANINFQFLHNPWCSLVKKYYVSIKIISQILQNCLLRAFQLDGWKRAMQSGNWNKRSQFHYLLLIYCFILDMTNNRFDMRTRFPLKRYFPLITVSVRHLHLKDQSD